MEITMSPSALLKKLLANMFLMYFKAHSYHWNVEGPNFAQYHAFFGDLYTTLHGNIDTIAEQIRALDVYAPISLEDLYSAKSISENTARPTTPAEMFESLLADNAEVSRSLQAVFDSATNENNQGLADFAAGLLDAHAKHAWMLKSFTK